MGESWLLRSVAWRLLWCVAGGHVCCALLSLSFRTCVRAACRWLGVQVVCCVGGWAPLVSGFGCGLALVSGVGLDRACVPESCMSRLSCTCGSRACVPCSSQKVSPRAPLWGFLNVIPPNPPRLARAADPSMGVRTSSAPCCPAQYLRPLHFKPHFVQAIDPIVAHLPGTVRHRALEIGGWRRPP